MKLLFWSYNDNSLDNSWKKYLSNYDFVEIRKGNILSESVTAVVSPANSFGFMDGGIDKVYRNYFGEYIEDRVKNTIKAGYDGELLVGQAVTVPTNNKNIPYLLVAPTMRTPTILNSTSPNVYLAMKAIIRTLKPTGDRMRDIRDLTISIPGLGTGVGRVPPEICAAQVKLAIDRFLVGDEWFPVGFSDAKLPGDNRLHMNDFMNMELF